MRILAASLVRQRRAKVVAFLTVAAGTTAVTSLAGLALDAGDRVMREMAAGEANIVVSATAGDQPLTVGGVIVGSAPGTLPVTSLAAISSFFWRNNILAVTPVLSTPARSGAWDLLVCGTWFDRPVAGAPWIKGGLSHVERSIAVDGRWPSDDPTSAEALLGGGVARRMKLAAGTTLDVSIAGRTRRFRIVGIASGGGTFDDCLAVPIEAAWDLTGRPGVVGRVLVQALTTPESRLIAELHKDPRTLPPSEFDQWYCTPYPSSIARRLADAIPGSQARPLRRASQTQGAVVGRLMALLVCASLLALAVAALGVAGTLWAAVSARAEEIGLLKALGGSSLHVASFFLAEAAAIAIAGGLVGFAGGTGLSMATVWLIFGGASGIKPALLPVALALALAVTAAGSLMPLATIVRLDPVRALRGE